MVRKGEENASWSPEESGLISREEFAEVLRFNCEKITSEDCGRSVPAVAGGRLTATDIMSATPIRKGR